MPGSWYCSFAEFLSVSYHRRVEHQDITMHRETILVTGGAGYIGSILVPMLLQERYRIRVFDLLQRGIEPLLPVLVHNDVELIKGDVRDDRELKSALCGVDSVINLAAIVGFPACKSNPNGAHTTNTDAVERLTSMLDRHQRFIQASTGSTYGPVIGTCDERTEINPISIYGKTKASAEKYVLNFGGVALRFATVFGISPRLRLDLLVNDIVYQAVHQKSFTMFEGSARRTFLHSTDAAKGIIFALRHYDKMNGRAFNVGDERLNYTKREVAVKIREQHDFHLFEIENGHDEDMRDYVVSYARIKDLGFSALVDLEYGIAELIKVLPFVKEPSPYRNA
jgi:nucleoside-diphosphate-sugar epimerase